jgi:hypothetical protein
MGSNHRTTRAASWKRFITCAWVLGSCAVGTGAGAAGEWELSGSVAGELRIFPDSPAFVKQNDATFSPSLSFEPRVVYEWNEGRDRLTAIPFLRFDAHDLNRTHADLREANWLHVGDGWDLVIGLDKVFWGVTESRHLVDIVNQDDRVEDIDGEDKLGQPMLNLNLFRDWGRLGIYVLPGFRKRTFPADDARLRGPLPIAGAATFDSGAGVRHTDLAVRWAHTIGAWDIGLAHFHGTSREPRFISQINPAGGEQLVPHYDQIDQTSFDLQLTTGAWLWKLEALTRSGQGDRFAAMVGGFEVTHYDAFGTGADLGLLAEYLYDGRNKGRAPPTALEDDIFLGVRLALNDTQNSSALIGSVFDRRTGTAILFVEAERRLGNSWRIEFESRLFFEVPDDDPLAGIRNDSFVTLRLSRFF